MVQKNTHIALHCCLVWTGCVNVIHIYQVKLFLQYYYQTQYKIFLSASACVKLWLAIDSMLTCYTEILSVWNITGHVQVSMLMLQYSLTEPLEWLNDWHYKVNLFHLLCLMLEYHKTKCIWMARYQRSICVFIIWGNLTKKSYFQLTWSFQIFLLSFDTCPTVSPINAINMFSSRTKVRMM